MEFHAAFDKMSGKTVSKYMNAAFAPHAALFDRAVIDLARAAETDRLTRCFAQEEPRTVLARLTLTLCPPVVHQLLEQTLTQGQDALLGTLALAYS